MHKTTVSINFIHPGLLFLLGHFFFGLVFVIAPVRIIHYPTFDAFLFYAISAFIILLTSILNTRFRYRIKRRVTIEYNRELLIRVLVIVTCLTVIGICFRLVDRFVLRGLDLVMSSYERKLAIKGSETSGFSIVSSFLYPLGLFVYPVVKFFRLKMSFLVGVLIHLIFIYPSIDVLLTGNRGLMIVTLGIYVFLQIYTGGFIGKRWKIIVMILILGVSFLVSLNIFITRISSFGFTNKYSANNSVYTFTNKPNNWANANMEGTTIDATMVFAYTNFCQYYIHGFLEFGYLLRNFEPYPHTLGRNTFYLFDKLLSKVFGLKPLDLGSVQPRTGIYTTFAGPLFVDFGILSIVVFALFGVLLNWVWKRVLRLNFVFFPLYLYLSVVVFFFPVVNLVQSGLGLFVLSSFVIFFLISELKKSSKFLEIIDIT